MTINGRHIDQRTVRSALALAAAAPSVHNSQPWRWVVGPHTIHLHADLARWLPATDADGRDMIVSCGAALHHARVALAAAGLASSVHRMPNRDEPDHLAAVALHPRPADDTDLTLAAAILRRRTDRRRFTDWEVPSAFIDELSERAAEQGALLRPVTAARSRGRLLEAIQAAAEAQESNVAYLAERAIRTGCHADVEGIPAVNLLRDAVVSGGGTAMQFSDGLVEQPSDGAPDGALLTVLATGSDDPLSQLRAGEALSAVLLHATELGLATCPLSRPLEVGTSRRTVRDEVLEGTAAPQLVLRVGWAPLGSPVRPTPRRPIDDMIKQFAL
ncbi:NAD(P)H nitroreductase [Pseudonocardia sp. DSM 110487]|uniref:Acg family FMN-binding oxidoreductase n=1 Tax=Pseudonocardia sp. DSM 110487 TaxID=2865833 RepID=UPI001C6A7C65|nr:NAD(P)H nitroreductase [Pseudonocardia sp. DSM 110487]QYN39314.1 NAD(P)H nitroreductase [Pseudonocardia sp. DSM 110487]